MIEIDTEIEYNGHTIKIKYDECPENPRTEHDNITEIHCRQSRYYLGEHAHSDTEEMIAEEKKAKRQGDFVLKVFAYIHSGVALSLESFGGKLPQGHAEFDSGCSGYIIIRREKMLKEFGARRWTKKLREKAYELCKGELEEFAQYINGEVYGYVIDDNEHSCWGYYSDEDCLTEAKNLVDAIENQKKEEAERKQPTLFKM